MNKYAKSTVIEKKTIVFPWKWTGNRTPEYVELPPNNKKIKVSYMRDGKILFEDGNSGVYIRIIDNNQTNDRAVQIELEV